METLYEDEGDNDIRKNRRTNRSSSLLSSIVPEPQYLHPITPGRRRSATAILKNGSEIILEEPDDSYDYGSTSSHGRSGDYNESEDDVDDIHLGGEAMANDVVGGGGGLEPPPLTHTPRGSLGGGSGSLYGSRCGSVTSQGSACSAS